jgi:hypothetical protein
MARNTLEEQYAAAGSAPAAPAASFEDEYAMAGDAAQAAEPVAEDQPSVDKSADFLAQVDPTKVRDMAKSKDYAGIGRYIAELINNPTPADGQPT